MKVPIWTLVAAPLVFWALGFGCNALAMYANDGMMPVLAHGCTQALITHYDEAITFPIHTCLTATTHLKFLCDIFLIRGAHVIASVGDFLEMAGELTFFPFMTGFAFLMLNKLGLFK